MGAAESAPGAADADEAAAARTRGASRASTRGCASGSARRASATTCASSCAAAGARGITALFERLAGRGFSALYEATRPELRRHHLGAPRDGRGAVQGRRLGRLRRGTQASGRRAASIDVYDAAPPPRFLVDPRDATTLDYVVDKLRGCPAASARRPPELRRRRRRERAD